MQSVEVRLTADRGWFGAFHRAVAETDAIEFVAVHEIRLLNDGTTVMLYEYRGEETTARTIADEYLEAADADWQTGTIDDVQLMYANAEPSPLVSGLLALLDEYRVVVDWPIRFRSDEGVRVTLVGDRGEIREACSSVPDGVRLRVGRTGEHRGEPEGVLAALTAREREVLEVAVESGYYRNPRETSYDDLASALDRSTGTVGEHLRNAESKVMTALFDDHESGRPRPPETV